ncbi:unnamed protein product, partial [Didymodactylos carnosus]
GPFSDSTRAELDDDHTSRDHIRDMKILADSSDPQKMDVLLVKSRLTFEYRGKFLKSGKSVSDFFTEFPAMKYPPVFLQEVALMSLTSKTADAISGILLDVVSKIQQTKNNLLYNETDPIGVKFLSVITSSFKESKQYLISNSKEPNGPWPSILLCTDVVTYYKVGLDGTHVIVTPNSVEALIIWAALYHVFNVEFYGATRKSNQFVDYLLFSRPTFDAEVAVKTLLKKLKIH